MNSQITIERFRKNVAIWSGRKKREVIVEVDYQSIRAGDFTLIHIARMQDTPIHDADAVPARREPRFLD